MFSPHVFHCILVKGFHPLFVAQPVITVRSFSNHLYLAYFGRLNVLELPGEVVTKCYLLPRIFFSVEQGNEKTFLWL